MDGQQPLLQGDEPDEAHEEALARPVLTDDEPDGGAAVRDALDVTDQRLEFPCPPDLDVLQADARDDARRQGLDDGVAVAGTDLGLDGHALFFRQAGVGRAGGRRRSRGPRRPRGGAPRSDRRPSR